MFGKPVRKRPLRRPRRRRKDNVRIDVKEIMWEDMDFMLLSHVDQWRALVNILMNLRVA